MLDGITVLDLASVGPAARASRWLADYGARVVKVGPVPNRQACRSSPPFYAYSAHRGMHRALVRPEGARGTRGVPRASPSGADVVIESFRPGVVDRARHRLRRRSSARNPRIVYCSTTGFGQTGPHSQWAGHDLNYLGVGGFLDCTGRGADGGPPIPGATVADSAGGGMHAVMAILAALVRRATTGERRLPRRVGRRRRARAHGARRSTSTSPPATCPGPATASSPAATRATTVPDAATASGSRVAAIEPRFWANLCARSGSSSGPRTRPTTRCRTRSAPTCARVFLHPRPRRVGRASWRRPTRAWRRCCRSPRSSTTSSSSRRRLRRGQPPDHGTFRQVGPTFAGHGAAAEPYEVRDATVTDTDELLTAAGFSADELAKLHEAGVIA